MSSKWNHQCGPTRGPGLGFILLSIMANFAYAGMRAQGSKSEAGRTFAFIAGFPGTFVSYLVVEEGSERAYGVDLPRKTTEARKIDQI